MHTYVVYMLAFMGGERRERRLCCDEKERERERERALPVSSTWKLDRYVLTRNTLSAHRYFRILLNIED